MQVPGMTAMMSPVSTPMDQAKACILLSALYMDHGYRE